jgi:imidazole glycerol-phosphate synthase subunit HisH
VSRTSIGIVDYGMGNRRSVEKAVERAGARAVLSGEAETLGSCDGLILPGVGAFPEAMRRLRERGLDELVRSRAAGGTPLLGLCLGMQLLFDRSAEHEGSEGLGLLPGAIVRLDPRGLKLPHIGWNVVTFRRTSPLVEGLGPSAAFYHVHSFVPEPSDPADVLGVGEYGRPFVSLVERERVFGAQCHPEKSSTAGLRVLANFAGICTKVPA